MVGIPEVPKLAPLPSLIAALMLVSVPACTKRSERSGAAPAMAPVASRTAPAAAPRLVSLEVGGMTCQGCVARVQTSLAAVPGVHRVDVSLDEQRAVVLADSAVRDTALTGAVRRAGSEFLGIVLR